MASIATVAQRDKLKVRRPPYWQKITTGGYLGFRKTSGTGTWLVRYYAGNYADQLFHSLGDLAGSAPHARYAEAMELARDWIHHISSGGSHDVVTIEDACVAYLGEKERAKGAGHALEVGARLKRLVLDHPSRIARVSLMKLTQNQMMKWRRSVEDMPALVTRSKTGERKERQRSAATVNRDMVAFRAALNLALENGHVLTDIAWRKALKPIKEAGRRKEVYLDREQRRTFLAELSGDIAVFARALNLLPLRPGATAKLNVGDYDARKHELRIKKDKAGSDRRILLPPVTNQFIHSLAKRRSDDEPLFVRENGERWNKDAWKKPIKAAARDANLSSEVTAYTLRHSTITDLVTGGLDLLTVAQISGTSAAMIEKHYGHLQKHRAADALAGLSL